MKPEPRERIRVVIADDHELARMGLRAMLATAPEIELVGEGRSGEEAVKLCAELEPRLALLDMRMPGLDGLAATRLIKEHLPQTDVILITMNDHPDYLGPAIKAGAAGYLLKEVTRNALLSTIRRVLRGELVQSREEVQRAFERMARSEPPSRRRSPEQLTPREYEVLELLVEGLTNREIGERLSLSAGTAKVHVERIISKLGVTDRTQAAVRAVKHGLLVAQRFRP